MMRGVIGLVGQVCAGKSTVAKAFKALGAQIHDSDAQVHELYKDQEIVRQIAAAFPTAVLCPLGISSQVDRKVLADLVFADEARMQVLKDIVFPHTKDALVKRCREFAKNPDPQAILLLDSPTLCEAGLVDLCDSAAFVCAPWPRRVEWAKKRHWEEKELKRRGAMLMPEFQKRALCSVIIENSGTEEELITAVGRLVHG